MQSIGQPPAPTRPEDSRLSKSILWSLQEGHTKYTYKGIPALKCPFDLALYSLLIWNNRPRTIIEIGSHRGGSALWLADQLRSFEIDGRIWSYDINPVTDVKDDLVHFGYIDAMKPAAAFNIDHLAILPRPMLVIEDSSHQRATSLSIASFFADILNPGEYLVIEDAIITELGISDHFDGGPGAAIAEFLASHQNWEIDRSYCDFFGENVTWNVNGYLRKAR